MDAYAVIAAFLIGIGPGSAVQPCPRHRVAHGDDPETRVAPIPDAHAEVGHSDHHPDGHPGSAHAEGSGAAPAHPHSDGPCDCLGICLTCSGPAQVASSMRAAQPASESRAPHAKRPGIRPAPDPAAHLRPFAQPPPA